MSWQVAGLGNALVDALVVLEDDSLIDELGLTRGTSHPVDHTRWQEIYDRVRAHKVTFDSGGSCANTVATVGCLGGKAIYCGQVGDDQLGHMYAGRMQAACGEHALRFSTTGPTGKCLSVISARDAERTMLTDLGAAITLPELGDYVEVLRRTRIGHFTGYTLLGPPMRDVVLEGMRAVKAAGGLVSLDVADPFVVAATRDLMWQVIRDHADIVFLNADETMQLTDLPPDDAVHAISDRGHVRTVVVKLGARGSLVLHDGELYRVGIRAVRAIDTTGAGDAYAGGFLYGFVHEWPTEQCGRLGAAVASLAVSQIGAVVKDRALLADVVREVRGGTAGEAA